MKFHISYFRTDFATHVRKEKKMKRITFIAVLLISTLKAYSAHNDQITSNLNDESISLQSIIIHSGACEIFTENGNLTITDSQIESKSSENHTSDIPDSTIEIGITSRYRSLFWFEGKKVFA